MKKLENTNVKKRIVVINLENNLIMVIPF